MTRIKVVDGPPPVTRYGEVAIDLEMFQLHKKQLHRPHGKFGCATFCMDGKTVYYIEDEKQMAKALNNIRSCRWIFHNGNFDIRHMRRYAEVRPRKPDYFWDTQYVEQEMYSGWYDSFSLKDLARRYLNQVMEKDTRKLFYEAEVMTDEMRGYAIGDAPATWKIFQAQKKVLPPEIKKVWDEVDQPAFWAILDFKGVMINQKKWLALAKDSDEIAKDIARRVGFNPNSPEQALLALAKQGIHLTSSGEGELIPYTDNELVQDILSYREYAKRASTYGKEWLKMVEEDGRIYPSFNLLGAETGRMSSDGPNFQQVPRNEEYRSCIVADKGNRLVIADFSQQEMKIAGQMSKNPSLLAVLDADDIYLQVAIDMYHNPKLVKKTKERQRAKSVALGILYGLSPYGLAHRERIPEREAAELFRLFFDRFPGIDGFLMRMKNTASQDWKARTLAGRVFHLNPYFKRWGNNAVNSPIQGTGAEMIKVALGIVHKKYGADLPILAQIHDELLSETNSASAKALGKEVKAAMQTAFRKFCPDVSDHNVVDVHVGATWAEK